MGYQIEIAFDMRIVGSMTYLHEEFVRKAKKNNCEMHYINYEMEGEGRKIVRNHSVMTFFFPPEKKFIVNFIRFAREFRDARIESISSGEIKCTLLYASSKYLSMMNHFFVKKYRRERHLLSEKDKSIVNEM